MENTNTVEVITVDIVPKDSGLAVVEQNNLREAFVGFFEETGRWKVQCENITDPALARTARLAIKRIRIAAEHKRKDLKAEVLMYGKAIDGANNILLNELSPLEAKLEAIEKQEERRIAARKQEILEERLAQYSPYQDASMPVPDFANMSVEQFTTALEDAKMLAELKAEAAEKAAAERLARKQAEEEAREAQRLENIRLKEEAEEREKAFEAERKAAAEIKAKEEAAAEKERQEYEAKVAAEIKAKEVEAQKLQKAAADKAKKELEKQAAAQLKKDEAAEALRVEIEAKAKVEREAAEAKAAAAEKEAKKLRDAEEDRKAIEAAVKLREQEAETARIEAELKAAAAPDKAKIKALAQEVMNWHCPEMATKEGASVAVEIDQKIQAFSKWIDKQADTL